MIFSESKPSSAGVAYGYVEHGRQRGRENQPPMAMGDFLHRNYYLIHDANPLGIAGEDAANTGAAIAVLGAGPEGRLASQ